MVDRSELLLNCSWRFDPVLDILDHGVKRAKLDSQRLATGRRLDIQARDVAPLTGPVRHHPLLLVRQLYHGRWPVVHALSEVCFVDMP